ncbi:DUF2460 domain-containing protein [Chitinolyticbacter meiyuanensis]|uniref:DUF2460 domain-containing protein n=1 Tax=Chitinolyticbacter meiyuanensis TaxID=682798 RepID=UPI0011E605A8|nr:DUF2460 domain-containing protein [Chitinolyticbacter meiyuanensis]
MAFAEERLPDYVNYGFTGGSTFKTDIVSVNSGAEQRKGVWANGRGEWDIDYVQGKAAFYGLRDFFKARGGRLEGFRFKDWMDWQDDGNGVLLSPALALGPDGGKTAQLGKRYASTAGSAELYPIRKPVNGTLQLKKAGVTQGGWTADYATGLVTFAPLTTLGIASITKGAVTTIQTPTPHGYTTGKVISFAGFTLQMAGLLNDKPWAITVTGASTFTIPADSTGLTGTFGTVVTYPIADENWSWTGDFDKPVRFDTDHFSGTFTDAGIYSINSLPIIEIKDFT